MDKNLEVLRKWNENNEKIVEDQDSLRVGETVLDLKEEKPIFKTHNIKTVYFYLKLKDESVTQYIKACEEAGVEVIPFLDRTELTNYLKNGENEGEREQDEKKEHEVNDTFMKEIKKNEIELIDHNKALRGSKLNDFSQIKRECEQKIIKPILSKKNKNNNMATALLNGGQLHSLLKNKEPIIIMSPSSTALLNMSNIKEFIINGQFKANNETNSSTGANNELVKLSYKSNKFNKVIKFLVVNNIDKFTIKPEYWDRVVAIFTTGQEWQFKNYKYKEPNVLFQKYKGFYVGWETDPLPSNITQWNVQVVKLERNARFKDAQVSQFMMESLERWMANKGYK